MAQSKAAKGSGKTKAAKGKVRIEKTIGFGVPATLNPHRFKVAIPRNNSGSVLISECLGAGADSGELEVIDRALLERPKWTAIRSEVMRAFNARLSERGLKTGSWKVGDNPVDRLLGKELCVLVWAVERLDIEKTPIAVRNWLALRPEERWWLFGMTAIASGGLNDSEKGWRIALRHALGDDAQSELFRPKPRLAPIEKKDPAPPSYGLWSGLDKNEDG